MKQDVGMTGGILVAAAMLVVGFLISSAAHGGESDLLAALSALQGHVDGSSPLSANQIESHKLTVDANQSIFGNTSATITASFDLVQAYDSHIGPMWSAGSPTENGYSRRNTSDDDIHWTMFHVMQYIVDDTYHSGNISTHQNLLDGYKFGSADVFPGQVTPPANPNTTHTATINGSFADTYGRNTMHWADRPARKPTGTYLAPGSITTITVPQSLVNQGYQVRVGGHSWDLSNKDPVDRLDRSSLLFDIDSTQVQVASPLGGNIYIEVPFEADAGVVDVQIQNAVRSPYFSMKDFDTTTLEEWQNVERNHQAPWADFQSEKFMMHVPTEWIYNLDDPVTLMQNWDQAMDITNDLMGFPRDRGKETLFDGVDVRIRAGAYAPGYPSVNQTYDPLRSYGGNHFSHLIRGPQYAGFYEFHEQGHGYLFPKFPGEVESNVNLLHVAVMQQGFGVDWDPALAGSMGHQNNPHRTLDNTAVAWMTSFNFFTKREPMHKLEKQYQLKGHAKFVEIARIYGWDKLGDYYQSFNQDYENGVSSPSSIDGMLLRLSEEVGADMTPLFHFWGVHPQNGSALKASLESAGIQESRELYDLLRHYQTLIPEDNAAFRQFAQGWWGNQPSINGWWTEHEHARQWDETELWDIPNGEGYTLGQQLPNGEMYTEESAALIRGVIGELLLQYYLEFTGDLNSDDTINLADWVIFIGGVQMDMSGLNPEQAYALGDLDGDFDNDIDDFDLFRRAYELVNPEPGAFQAMLAQASVPEPSTLLLLAVGVVVGFGRRRKNGRI